MRGLPRSLEEALALAADGIPVFPCRSDKSPACSKGFEDAAIDPHAIRALWSRSGALIGVPTGPASGFDALDIDPRHGGGAWWMRHRHRLPSTRIHRTRSGGLHALFRHAGPVRCTVSKIARGVDTRGLGGYIIWWPAEGCQIVDVPIAPWPPWLLRALAKATAPKRRPTASGRPYTPLSGTEAADTIAAAMIARVAAARPGERYETLRKAAYTVGGLIDHLPFGIDEACRRLTDAAERAGAEDLKHAARIASWGLGHGCAKPLKLESRDAG